MASGSLINLDTSGLKRIGDRLTQLSGPKLAEVRKRSAATLARRLKAEAARQVSQIQLNLAPGQIAPYINVTSGSTGDSDFVSVTADKKRLPLRLFKARITKKSGASVTTWKDAAPVQLPHGFRRGNDVWQRVPFRGQKGGTATPLGLVQRLPIVLRKGPSLKRALQPAGPSSNEHGRTEVVNNLMEFGQTILAAEIQRLLNLK